MKKLKKILLVIGIGLVALIVITVIAVGFFIGPIVKMGIETVGSETAKVSVKLDSVHLSLLTGSAKIKGLVIGNPEGYKTPYSINISSAVVGINPLSLLSDKIVVRSVRIETAEITFEGNPFGKNNLSQIMDNINAIAKSGAAPSANTPARADRKPAIKIEVDDFLITGAKVHVNLSGMGGKEMTLPPLPPIHLTDLGKGEEGITSAELTRRVLGVITTYTVKAVVTAVTGIGNNAGELGKGAGKAVGEGANKITKGIGNLFGK